MRGWEIVKKDLKLLFRDRRALATLVALPLIFITVIGLTTGQLLGWADNNKILTIVVVDETNREQLEEQVLEMQLPESNQQVKFARARNKNLVAKLYNSLQSREGMELHMVPSRKAAEDEYKKGTSDAALIIGPEFIERAGALKAKDIMAYREGQLADGLEALDLHLESENPDSTTHGIVQQFIFFDAFSVVALCPFCNTGLMRAQIRETCEEFEALADAAPIPLDSPKPQNLQSNGVYQELIPGMTVMFVFFLVNIMAHSFIQERELGTLRRLRIAPIGSTSLLTGKTIPFFIISLTQTLLLFGCGKVVFGMDWGKEPILLLPVIFATSVAATSLGLLIATIVKSDSQVSAYANLVVVGLAGISGCFMPREWLPQMMQEISLYTPHAWALIAYDQLLHQPIPNVAMVMESCAMLMGFGILFFSIGCLRFAKID